MIANFHTHTFRCGHASGTDREYVEEAIKRGLKVLGFSDHSPYLFDDGYYSNFRMRPEQTDSYVDSVLSLREEYKDDIEIKLGFETEYYPKYFERLLRFYENYPVDYIIMGQHFTGNEIGGVYSGRPHQNKEYLEQYVNQVIEGLRTGCFTYLAHPDLFNYHGDASYYKNTMKKLCRAAKKLEIPLEINLLGVRSQRDYPRRSFFEAAAECQCDVILGSDAHSPEAVCDIESEKKVQAWIDGLGLKVIDNLKLRKPV